MQGQIPIPQIQHQNSFQMQPQHAHGPAQQQSQLSPAQAQMRQMQQIQRYNIAIQVLLPNSPLAYGAQFVIAHQRAQAVWGRNGDFTRTRSARQVRQCLLAHGSTTLQSVSFLLP